MMENTKNKINLEIRSLLAIIDMIEGVEKKYPDYEIGELTDEEYLEQHLLLVTEAKNRLVNIFKD